jgi:PKHD-type hydroxylase
MILPFLIPFQDKINNFCYMEKVFSKEECDFIIKIGNSYEPKESFIGTKNSKITKDYNQRSSKTAWMPFNEENKWIFSRIAETALELNEKYFNFDIRGFSEPIQFTHYHHKKRGHYDSHLDSSKNSIVRKLSISVQLSLPNYKGGDLKIITGSHKGDKFKMIKEQGTLIMFPSYILHKVTPVTKGERYSLVSWLTGPSLK